MGNPQKWAIVAKVTVVKNERTPFAELVSSAVAVDIEWHRNLVSVKIFVADEIGGDDRRLIVAESELWLNRVAGRL